MLNILAKEPLKHAAYLLQGTLLVDSEGCCGAAFGSICEWHKTVNSIMFGWVCVGATEPVNIPTSGHLPAHWTHCSLALSFAVSH